MEGVLSVELQYDIFNKHAELDRDENGERLICMHNDP
jgi:hypothetical protein